MKNTLSLYRHTTGVYKTEYHFTDGCTMWELQREGLSESDVLVREVEKKYFQHLPGPWEILLPHDHKVIQDPDYAKAVQMTLRYIYDRDNPEEPEYFC